MHASERKKEKERKRERETRNKGGENASRVKVFDPVFGGKEYAVWLARAHRDDARMVGTTPVPMIASRFDSELYASRRFTSSRFLFVCLCVRACAREERV